MICARVYADTHTHKHTQTHTNTRKPKYIHKHTQEALTYIIIIKEEKRNYGGPTEINKKKTNNATPQLCSFVDAGHCGVAAGLGWR